MYRLVVDVVSIKKVKVIFFSSVVIVKLNVQTSTHTTVPHINDFTLSTFDPSIKLMLGY